MASRSVVVLDADVLVPILSCDLLLCAFDHDLFQPVVTRRILAEVERTLLEDFPHLDTDALARRATQIAHTLALHTHPDVPTSDAVRTVNAKDRHVAVTALANKADAVTTNDRRLRRELNRLDPPVRAITADELMVGLHEAQPPEVDAVIDTMIAKRVRQPVTRAEMLGQLTEAFPRFVDAVSRTR